MFLYENNNHLIHIKDFNVKNGYSYQYVIFPNQSLQSDVQSEIAQAPYLYANTNGANDQFNHNKSKPVAINWHYWSLVELIQADNKIDAPIAEATYEVNPESIWIFKYNVDTGSLNQNIAKGEMNTLGQFSKIGHGLTNYIDGSVSAYLGSEVVPASKIGYLERLPLARRAPLTTNDKAAMLKAWRAMIYSKNPKLLRDSKGESWIVQTISGSNTPNNNVYNYPDTISFSWKQIGTTETSIIYCDDMHIFDEIPTDYKCVPSWIPKRN